MPRLMHIADLHLGCRQYGMQEREEDFYLALGKVSDIAIKEQVDFIVMSGDLFDSSKPTARAVLELTNFVRRMKQDGIHVVGIEGNHDLTADGYWLRVCDIWPLGCAPFTESFKDIRVAGFDFVRSETLVTRLEEFADQAAASGETWPVVALHCGLAEMGAGFAPDLSMGQIVRPLKAMGCRYVALGHIHIPMEQVEDGIAFVQPGSLEMKSVDEPRQKVAEIVTMDDAGNVVSMEQVPYLTRGVSFVNVEAENDLATLRDTASKPGQDGRPQLVVAYVSGELRDGAARAAEAVKGTGCLFRAIPCSGAADAGSADRYDRRKSMDLLKDSVAAFFDEASPQYKMVLDIISTGNPRLVVERFMNGDSGNTAA